MNQAVKMSVFRWMDLISLLEQQQYQREHEPPYAEPHVRWCERTTEGGEVII